MAYYNHAAKKATREGSDKKPTRNPKSIDFAAVEICKIPKVLT